MLATRVELVSGPAGDDTWSDVSEPTDPGAARVARFPYDRGSKWLLQHHGDALLRLGGIMTSGCSRS